MNFDIGYYWGVALPDIRPPNGQGRIGLKAVLFEKKAIGRGVLE